MSSIISNPVQTFSPSKDWLRALELTSAIGKNPNRILSSVIEEFALTAGERPALLSDQESMTYSALSSRANQYTRWALEQGLGKGGTVCLLMPNRPEYMAIWLGISRTGCVVALLNTSLAGRSLAHCVNLVNPKHVITTQELAGRLIGFQSRPKIWIHSADLEIERYSGEALNSGELRAVTIEDRALLVYTSGTTGLPKAANISHARILQWSLWFAGLMNTGRGDRLYSCLPMYHSVGGVQATGALLAAGGSVVIGDGFSASQFWSDIVRWDCTLFQYIGELCRYLLNGATHPSESKHRIRMCCGNGLRADIWNSFQDRFHIPRILEFYAATEGNVSLFNVEGKPGAIGRVPSYLAHRFPAALARFDIEQNELVRNEQGLCVRCAPDETGEALGKMFEDPSNAGARFDGYTNKEDSEKKIARNVFEPGDAWFRTGDLLRKDESGYYYFVDRIGDTFRWKGENVSTEEVAEAICDYPGILQANVYGVTVPGAEGRAGMAMLVAKAGLDLAAFRIHLSNRLPYYAHPLFLRLRGEMEITGTFKYKKTDLMREGFDPAAANDVIYFNDRQLGAFIQVDAELYSRIQSGQVRL